jgi:hypothetical protein
VLFDYHYTNNDSSTAAGTFTVGGTEGQFNGTSTGALSGALVTGHRYEWFYRGKLEAFPNADSGAGAFGDLRLSFTDSEPAAPDATPLPGAAMGGLLLLGCLSTRGLGRRRRGEGRAFVTR